jgi:hypothetical protein
LRKDKKDHALFGYRSGGSVRQQSGRNVPSFGGSAHRESDIPGGLARTEAVAGLLNNFSYCNTGPILAGGLWGAVRKVLFDSMLTLKW